MKEPVQRGGPCVIIATYRRPVELRRLLVSFEAGSIFPALVVVADNAAAPETAELLGGISLPCVYLPLPENPGPGAAWKAGAERVWQERGHRDEDWFLFCDDDILPDGDLLGRARESLARDDWELAAPLLLDENGKVWGFPEPEEPALRKIIRQSTDPQELRHLLGPGPHKLCWATGACLFVTGKALQHHGLYRTDFFMLGEDLEFSMRVAAGARAVFYPEWQVPHWPLPAQAAPETLNTTGHRRKFLSLLQNLTFLSFHSPHSRHLKRYLPGNYRRYLRSFGAGWRSWREMFCCFWAGGVLGEPAGGPRGQRLRNALEEHK